MKTSTRPSEPTGRRGALAITIAVLALFATGRPATASVGRSAGGAAELRATADSSPVMLAKEETGEKAKGKGKRAGAEEKEPVRGSSAQIGGGTSADRYGGTSADRGGAGGPRDTRLMAGEKKKAYGETPAEEKARAKLEKQARKAEDNPDLQDREQDREDRN